MWMDGPGPARPAGPRPKPNSCGLAQGSGQAKPVVIPGCITRTRDQRIISVSHHSVSNAMS